MGIVNRIFCYIKDVHLRRPILMNTATFSLLYAAGDISQQTMRQTEKYDFTNTMRVSAAGGGFGGPFYYYWYKFLDGCLPGITAKTIVKKIVCDQAVAGILGTFVFYTVTSILEGRRKIFDEAIKKGPPTFLTGCVFWPIVQYANFKLIPTRYKAMYVATAGFFWTNIICYIKSCNENVHTEDTALNS